MATEDEIQQALDDINEDLSPTQADKKWTHAIKSGLVALGKGKRYWVYASGIEQADGGEWLFDLCWLTYSEKHLLSVELAFESEWKKTTSDIDDDFQKLLVAKAELKCMVFQALKKATCESIFERLITQIRRFTSTKNGDRYLLSGWVNEDKRFYHRRYCHVPS